MKDRRILITGATGQLAFPVAAALAVDNVVWGLARFSQSGGPERLTAHGITPVTADLGAGAFDELPDKVDHVLHFAADIVDDDFDRALTVNAEGTGLLLAHYASAASALVVSSTVVYDLRDDPRHAFAETDPLGDSKPLFGLTYPISKIAQEGVARAVCRMLDLPVTIARMNLSYGANGGLPAYQLDAIRRGDEVTVAAHDTFHNPFHQDDIVASIPALLDIASTPATVLNWAGPEMVSMRDYCATLGDLTGAPVRFAEVDGFIRSRGVDTTRQHELIGVAPTGWREGMARLVDERPEPETEPT